jgi:hypothetical protein
MIFFFIVLVLKGIQGDSREKGEFRCNFDVSAYDKKIEIPSA